MTVVCDRCRFTFLSIPQEKLLLGASLFMPQRRQQQQAAAAAAPPAAAAAAMPSAGGTKPLAATQPSATPAQAAGQRHAALAEGGVPLVDSPEVLAVVAEASGLPVECLSESDWQPLAELEARLRRRVAGQDTAVAAVVGAVRLGRLGLQRGKRPLASLLLTGPAGVGKATLCQALAEALFGSDRYLLRFNLAELADRASGDWGGGRQSRDALHF